MSSDKEKAKPQPAKNIPKDGQVIMAILKEMGVTEYEPKTIVQLTEFVYRYGTSILEEARMFATNSKKKSLDLDDIRLALQLSGENTFTMPPSREILLEVSRNKNKSPLPLVKPHCGLRLPPDRHCLNACNYTLRAPTKKSSGKSHYSVNNSGAGLKLTSKSNVNYVKRTSSGGTNKQSVTIPKPITKVTANTNNQQQKTVLKPKIQITQNSNSMNISNAMEVDGSLKRKRADDDNS